MASDLSDYDRFLYNVWLYTDYGYDHGYASIDRFTGTTGTSAHAALDLANISVFRSVRWDARNSCHSVYTFHAAVL